MKFQRGRKKNQFNWSFILKDIASRSFSQISVLIKSEKRKTYRLGIRFPEKGSVLQGNTPTENEHALTGMRFLEGQTYPREYAFT